MNRPPMLILRVCALLAAIILIAASSVGAQEVGITATSVRLGGVMDLEGDSRGLGLNMRAGLNAAFRDRTVKGRHIEFIAVNDFYNPPDTIAQTNALIERGIFAMIGNVGTPTARVALPILKAHNVPAVGFFTGAGLLRPGVGDIINYRASYVQEVSTVIRAALAAGVQPAEICAFVQNDSYGMAGVAGITRTLSGLPGAESVVDALERLAALEGPRPARNFGGPIGVYERNTLYVRDGYDSLKIWETATGNPCRLVITVGAYAAIARFVGYARYRGESWLFSAVSFTGAANLRQTLALHGVEDGVIMTQVVPALDSPLPLVAKAREALGNDLNYVSLEGFIVGRMFLAIADAVEGPLTREHFLSAVLGRRIHLDGLTLDFTSDNQGSDFVLSTYLDGEDYHVLSPGQLQQLFRR